MSNGTGAMFEKDASFQKTNLQDYFFSSFEMLGFGNFIRKTSFPIATIGDVRAFSV